MDETHQDSSRFARFGMSSPPAVGGQPGDYEERWTQWFLEQSFFRDFVYRNPRGKKKGTELADALVLFGDVALLVQVKAQKGKHDPVAWATEKLLEAFRQLRVTHAQLGDGGITKLDHEIYGTAPFVSATYPNHIGLIVLAQEDAHPFDATFLAPELLTGGFPVHVFSLHDFGTVAARCDTAADFITFLELRSDVLPSEPFKVHEEERNITRIIPHIKGVLVRHMSPSSPRELENTVAALAATASGIVRSSPEYNFSLAIDDIIARTHDILESADTSRRRNNLVVAEFLGWLTRTRRIELGKRLVQHTLQAQDGKDHYFVHIQPARGTACVYLATAQDRSARVETLKFLVAYAQMKHGVPRCLGVATEPVGTGRSYDFTLREGPLPADLIEELRRVDDPFGATQPLRTPE